MTSNKRGSNVTPCRYDDKYFFFPCQEQQYSNFNTYYLFDQRLLNWIVVGHEKLKNLVNNKP